MGTISFNQPVARTKWRGKTMCFKPNWPLVVGEAVELVMLPSGDVALAPKKAKLFYGYQSANEAGQMGHAQDVVYALAEKQGFTVERGWPESLYDGWVFEIEYTKKPKLPRYITMRTGQHGDE